MPASRRLRPAPRRDQVRARAPLPRADRRGLPRPTLNTLVEGYEVDALWREQKLIVELDGFGTHRTRAAFERDRKRDAALLAAGHRTLRVTARRLDVEPAAIIAPVGALLTL